MNNIQLEVGKLDVEVKGLRGYVFAIYVALLAIALFISFMVGEMSTLNQTLSKFASSTQPFVLPRNDMQKHEL